MKSNPAIIAAIAATLAAAQGDAPFFCHATKSPEKEVKKQKKKLRASENWRVQRNTIWSGSGNSFNGIASWGENVTVALSGHEFRFRILQIDRQGWRACYAIPIKMVDGFSALPGIDLSASEITLIKDMADELSQKRSVPETVRYIPHPARADLTQNRNQWDGGVLDFSELLRMLQTDHTFCNIITAALAAHYRSFLPGDALPEGIYNFVIPQKNRDADQWLYSILQALTFTNITGKNAVGPITITMKEAQDLTRWKCCHERLAVIRTATGALLWPLLEEIEERDQLMRGGGIIPTPLPTVPISLTRSYLHHPQAIDIPLPAAPPAMTGAQLDLLRAGMSRLLRRKIAESALQAWENRRANPVAYRISGLLDWNEVLLETCLNVWFPDSEYHPDRKKVLADTKQHQEAQERAVSEILQRGLDLLTNPSRYKDDIIERPSSKAEWEDAAQNGTLAFWYTPKRGDDMGNTFLAFTADTLKILLSRAGCTEGYYEAFLRRCSEQTILDKKNRTIKLRKDEITAITFYIQKP